MLTEGQNKILQLGIRMGLFIELFGGGGGVPSNQYQWQVLMLSWKILKMRTT